MEKLIIPLSGDNYCTWKVQVRMLLINHDLWNIVNGNETIGAGASEKVAADFTVRKNKALSTIVLTVSPSLFYLLGDPTDPTVVWGKLENHFQKPC